MIYGNIELTKFICSEIHTREVNGVIEECISIPIRSNGLSKSKSGRVFMPYSMKERRPNPDNITHYVSVNIKDEKIRKRIEEYGFANNLKFIGYAKSIYYKKGHPSNVVSLDDAMNK